MTSFPKIRRDSMAILFFGAFYCALFIWNRTYAFDDMLFFGKFSDEVDVNGVMGAAWRIFLGADLASEYRTYGLSRLLHFLAFLVFGDRLLPYEVLICFSQVVSGLLLLRLARFLGAGSVAGVALALTWMLSTFSVNWSFHHYSYALLPFQLLIFALHTLLVRARPSFIVLTLLGVALALTGELQLLAAPLLMLFSATERRARGNDGARVLFLFSVFLGSVVAHRILWAIFFQDQAAVQRFSVAAVDWPTLVWRSAETLSSVFRMLSEIGKEIWQSRPMVGFVAAVFSVGFCWLIMNRTACGSSENNRLLRLGGALFFAALSAFSIYFFLSVATGQISNEMPRRYGFGAFSLLSVSVVCILGGLSKRVESIFGYFAIFVATGLIAQVMIVEVHPARKVFKSTVVRISEILERNPRSGKGVFLFSSGVRAYEDANATAGTAGPLSAGASKIELLQDPLFYYWTAQHYFLFIMKVPFAAMPPSDAGKSGGSLGGRPPAVTDQSDGVVLANLRLSELDPKSRELVVFENYEEFSANKFSRRVDRELNDPLLRGGAQFAIDLGEKSASNQNFVPDKTYGAGVEFKNSWVKDYGYLSGQDSIYGHPGIGPQFFYYQTNRNGNFVYKISFNDTVRFEASFDFWEQWGKAPGERVFDLDVSWDGVRWVNVGRVDPAALNGNKPFSIAISRANTSMMLFRLVPVFGDTPFMQGVRIRRLQ